VEGVERDGATVALLPLQRSPRPVRELGFVGAGVADQTGIVCAAAELPGAAAELRRLIGRLPHDIFVAERLAGDEPWGQWLGAEPALVESSPVVDIETSDWDDFLGARSSNFRQQVRKFERRLERDHGLRYRLSAEPADLDRDLDVLFELHGMRWGAGATEFQREPARSFHRDFARSALEQGWLRLWIAELDGRPAAVWHGFRFGEADWFYQQGRDPALDRTSVGFVLTAHALREAVHDGMRQYKFLLGGEDYKARFATRDPGLQSFVLPRTMAGRLGHFATRAARRLRARRS
jgi:CelD/BcsL family acetyltransferase involved in cellulose biosynthesis